jgi:hypothetical protein
VAGLALRVSTSRGSLSPVRFRSLLNERAAIIVWNFLVVAIVLAATSFAPVFPSIVGAATALALSYFGPSQLRRDIGLRRPTRPLATLAAGVLAGVLLFFFTKLFLEHLCEIITHSPRDLSAFDFTRGHFRTEIPLIITIALRAGFCEEVIYRGTIISRLEASVPRTKATTTLILFVSAAVFAVAHVYQGPAGVMVTGLIGLLLAYVYAAWDRLLWPVVMIHLTYDLLSLTAISSNLDKVLQGWSLALFRTFML